MTTPADAWGLVLLFLDDNADGSPDAPPFARRCSYLLDVVRTSMAQHVAGCKAVSASGVQARGPCTCGAIIQVEAALERATTAAVEVAWVMAQKWKEERHWPGLSMRGRMTSDLRAAWFLR